MGRIDYQGISILLGAIAALVTVLGGLGIQIATFRRQGRMELAGQRRDGEIAVVKGLVNGLSDKRNAATEKSSFAEGKLAGGDEERLRPTGPLPPR